MLSCNIPLPQYKKTFPKVQIPAKNTCAGPDIPVTDGTILTAHKATVDPVLDHAFSGCKQLTSVTIGAGVRRIRNNSFEGCRGLTDITIPDKATEIGNSAFDACWNLRDVTIGAQVTKIGQYAFIKCEGLTRAVFKAPSGWTVESKEFTTPKSINQNDLEDASKAAEYLKNTYRDYTWQKQ